MFADIRNWNIPVIRVITREIGQLNFPAYVCEGIGTFILTLTAALHPGQGSVNIGFMLTALIFMGGHISGGHFNPGVTFAVFLSGRDKINRKDTFIYWLVQCGGGFVGAFTAAILLGDDMGWLKPKSPIILPWIFEFIFSFMLQTTVLNVATTRSQSGNGFFGLAIGCSVVGAGSAGAGISGGVLNPAIGLGLSLTALFARVPEWKYVWLYCSAPMAGSVVAAAVFRIMNKAEYGEQEVLQVEVVKTQQPQPVADE